MKNNSFKKVEQGNLANIDIRLTIRSIATTTLGRLLLQLLGDQVLSKR